MKALKVGMVLLMVLVTAGIAIAMTSANANIEQDIKLPSELTQEELQKLYKKYSITENDIKFAKGELPHYLEGTILDGKVVTMGRVTENGDVENWTDPLFYKWCIENGYKVIPAKKALEIEKKAIEDYIKKYGVDPANPRVENVNGILLPREYVKKLIQEGILSPKVGTTSSPAARCSEPNSVTGPWAIYGDLYLWIVEAGDQQHKPVEAFLQDTLDAYSRFYQFGVDNLYYYKYYDYWTWDASDVYPSDNSSKLLDDLRDDTNWVRNRYNDGDPTNDIVIGWVKYADHNGDAYCNGFFGLGATDSPWFGWADWPHDSIAQHEISHLFNAGEGGFWCGEHPECIMNYCWASGLHGTKESLLHFHY